MANKCQGGDHSKQMNFKFWVAGEDATCDFNSFVVMDVFFPSGIGMFFSTTMGNNTSRLSNG